MKKFYALMAMVFLFTTTQAQRLLSWTPEFPQDNSTVTFTVDCTKGNQGLLNYESGSSNNVYVHVGVITSANPTAGAWAYVPFTWGTAKEAADIGNGVSILIVS